MYFSFCRSGFNVEISLEIAALLSDDRGGPARKPKGRVQAERVLLGWWSDPKFRDRSGAPVRLPRRGAKRSFAALVKQHSGDAHNSAPILEELLRSQAVREHPDGTLEAISRACTRVRWDEEGIQAFGEELSEHVETLLYNLKHPEQPRFAKRVVCTELDAYAARVLIPDLMEQAELFLEGAEESLGRPARAKKSGTRPTNALRFSVGLQFFQEPVPPPAPKGGPRSARRTLVSNGRSTRGPSRGGRLDMKQPAKNQKDTGVSASEGSLRWLTTAVAGSVRKMLLRPIFGISAVLAAHCDSALGAEPAC